ncbi:hypothetical protein SVA_3562 [Sulfurifustis variabilis]|uniref:DUF4124 domain-containing protein n=1 Tax=Sulfurifustis variabilis TaxID=1675686 RepID=A0A1C7AFI8_9GAMM|nr:hypothetical protein [Sulfurifustis variabilis]BAU50098.1 hypothetical protein SVA_3562 [Sulfurifustis variabilis]
MAPRYLLPLLALVAALVALPSRGAEPPSPPTGKIKKCQDATGRWHYGDTAADECARSKVTLMSEKGIKRHEIAAPLTDAELKKRQADATAEEKAKEQEKRDGILLSTYAHEADIIYVRDRKLAQLEQSIKASQETVDSLRAVLGRQEAEAAAEQKSGDVSDPTAKAVAQTRSQIQKHEAAIAMKREEQAALKKQAEADLERYRALKGSPRRADAAPATR